MWTCKVQWKMGSNLWLTPSSGVPEPQISHTHDLHTPAIIARTTKFCMLMHHDQTKTFGVKSIPTQVSGASHFHAKTVEPRAPKFDILTHQHLYWIIGQRVPGWSANHHKLIVPHHYHSTFGRHVFSVAGPQPLMASTGWPIYQTIWDSLTFPVWLANIHRYTIQSYFTRCTNIAR